MKCALESCNNNFENKTGRRKFCSDACKMKWHRMNPKKEEVTKFDLKVVYNELLDLAQKLSAGIVPQVQNTSIGYFKDEPGEIQQPKFRIKRTFDNFLQLKKECETEDDWIELKDEISNAENLSSKQKSLLINPF